MNGADRSKLDEILGRHDRRMEENAQREVNETKAKTEFTRAFLEHCISIIRPAMMEVGEILRAKGHDYRIIDNLTKKIDGADLLKIDFQIINTNNRNHSAVEVPHIAFSADKSARNIRIDETVSETAPRDKRLMTLDQATMDNVQARIIRAVDYTFR